jgi:hypothetical protein
MRYSRIEKMLEIDGGVFGMIEVLEDWRCFWNDGGT